jgi:zinc carboxypeptidase
MRIVRAAAVAGFLALVSAAPASATPVCTDGYMGGPPASLCGGRIFPEAELARGYIQYTPDAFGFIEYQHGIEYLAQKYPRWISVFRLSDLYGGEALSAGPDELRSYEDGDAGDGRDIQVIKITDHNVPDEGKDTLLFSLSVHGNERGGLEGGVRTAEDLAIAAEEGGTIADGVANYDSSTGREPAFHEYDVADVLAKEAVYLVDFNVDGWAVGDWWNQPLPSTYTRGNTIGTDLNRQMPTIGRVNPSRNPLQESEMKYGTDFMHQVASQGQGGKMAYGADIHGELNSQAYMDIMYPAGEFDSVDHRRLMAIAERTKSVIDDTLYEGIVEEIENASGGNDAEYARAIPLKPAHWATVWDTLGYTDTGFIGDYMATDLGVTGMDYEIMFNHTVPEKFWNVYLQENHITASRGIIKTAMAYTLFQQEEFNDGNVKVDPVGRAGFVVNPDTVTDTDENGPGTLPGPDEDGIGADGQPVEQRPYEVTNQTWFRDENRLMPSPFRALAAADIAADPKALDVVDTLVLADVAAPADSQGRSYDTTAYYANLKAWVERGGNLVLTDKALHALGDLGIVPADSITDINVYQPYANFQDFDHPMTDGLRPNAHQLVEAATLGYGIGSDESPMTVVDTSAWEGAGGHVIGTTTTLMTGEDPALDRPLDDGALTSVGELPLGDAGGFVRIVGGALPTPSEEQDHRYGLRNYALTYSGLFLMENAIQHDVEALGVDPPPPPGPGKKPKPPKPPKPPKNPK